MSKRVSCFRFYTANFLDGTNFMTASETGDYIRLLAAIYDQGGKVPNDPYLLRHLLQRCQKAPDAIRRVQRLIELGKLFTDSDGHLHNGRADKEILKRKTLDKNGFQKGSSSPSSSPSSYGSGTPEKSTNSTRARPLKKMKVKTSPKGDVTRASARGPPQSFSEYLTEELRSLYQQEEINGHTIETDYRRLETGNGSGQDGEPGHALQAPDAKPH